MGCDPVDDGVVILYPPGHREGERVVKVNLNREDHTTAMDLFRRCFAAIEKALEGPPE